MKWLIVERHQAPVFTGFVRVKVGGLDERPGITGLAHLFEHMAFKGTPVLGTTDFEKEKALLARIGEVGDALAALVRKGQADTEAGKELKAELEALTRAQDEITDENTLITLYQLHGAEGLNATTDKDLTSYFVSLPKNRLRLWALVEASRLASPVLRDFYTERDVVMEERRMRTDSQPGGALYEELNQLAFTTSPYRWPTVGYMEDLAAMTLAEATAFHRRFYVPANTVGCLVGDFQFEEAVKVLEETFGAIPAGPPPSRPVFATPPRRAARRSVVSFDANPLWALAFHKPSLPHRDDYIFDVINVLVQGRTGRLHRRLVLRDRLAQSVGAFGAPGSRLSNLFVTWVVPLGEGSLPQIEKAVWDELERLKREKISEAELQKVRNRVSADQARSLDSNSGLAGALSYFEALAGDWRYVADHPKVIASITADDVQRVARTYFVPENSVTVELRRPQAAAAAKRKEGGR
jgi:predicted Zn-dependent peptidase